MSAFLLRFKANYFEKMHGFPHFSLWIPIALAKIYFFCVVLGFSFEAGDWTFHAVVFYSLSGTFISIFEGFFIILLL